MVIWIVVDGAEKAVGKIAGSFYLARWLAGQQFGGARVVAAAEASLEQRQAAGRLEFAGPPPKKRKRDMEALAEQLRERFPRVRGAGA